MPKRYEHKVFYVHLSFGVSHQEGPNGKRYGFSYHAKKHPGVAAPTEWSVIAVLEADGWELVTVTPVISGTYGYKEGDMGGYGYSFTEGLYLFFKRPVGEETGG